jgi:hypothetical protein
VISIFRLGTIVPAAFKSFVPNSVKGDIGEALSYLSIKIEGESTSQLSQAQRAAAALQGDDLTVQYWDYPTVSGMLGAGPASGAATGANK